MSKLEHGLVINGNCIEVMGRMPEEGFHAVVCDPPYTVGNWDSLERHQQTSLGYQAWNEEWARAAKRVLKPGGHLLAFSSARHHHRMWSGIEDAGFEIRDTVAWHYGSGFPKGVRLKTHLDDEELVEKWGDWRGMLKPATEYIVLARKPTKGSATANQVEHGTGNLNVEACRVPTGGERSYTPGMSEDSGPYAEFKDDPDEETVDGRFPSNLVLGPMAALWMDSQSGESKSVRGRTGDAGFGAAAIYGDDDSVGDDRGYTDSGGASRFFYCAKVKNDGERTMGGRVEVEQPTIKPIDLMAWLVRMVTAEGQRVLDPFCGSGSTLIACEREGRVGVGIEKDAGRAETARARFTAYPAWRDET